jgi:hypothetical protein
MLSFSTQKLNYSILEIPEIFRIFELFSQGYVDLVLETALRYLGLTLDHVPSHVIDSYFQSPFHY